MSSQSNLLTSWVRPVALCAVFLPSLSLFGTEIGRARAQTPTASPEAPAEVATTPDPAKDQGKGPWEKVSTSDGILVERRTVPGSNLKEFRGRGVVEASLGRVLAIIRDAPHRCEWMAQCESDYIVEENEAARVQISYHRTKAPWPVADRDSINRAELRVDPVKHRVFLPFEGISHPKVPVVKGVVRMPFLRGHWILQPATDGKATEVEYQVHANPGGALPEWIANLASKKLPLLTIIGLRKQSKVRSYPAFEAEIANSKEAKEMAATGGKIEAAPAAPSSAATPAQAAPPTAAESATPTKPGP